MNRSVAVIVGLCLTASLLAGCTKRASVPASPPPAVLPGVEAVDVKSLPIPRAERPATQPLKKLPGQPLKNLYFAFGVDSLKPGQIRQLARLALWASVQGKAIHVTGYADTVGSVEDNLALSLRRALAVSQHLPVSSVEAGGETVRFGADNRNRKVTLEAR